MKQLKDKIILSESAYINFETGFYYLNDSFTKTSQRIKLSPTAIKILKCLCSHYNDENNGFVSNIVIFEYVYGKSYKKPEEMKKLTKAISELRTTDIGGYIESLGRGNFKLTILESPFEEENIEKTEKFVTWSHPTEAPSLHEAYETFLKEKVTVDDELEEVIIVHNHGIRALMNQTRNTLLKTLIDRAESVKILITEYEMGEIFTQHIRNHNVFYLSSYTPPVLMWQDFCKQFPNKVTLHLSPIPAIHQYTELKFKNSSNTSSFVGFYTYGGTAFDRSPFMIIPYESAYYSNFHTEFEYAWGISHPCTDSTTSQKATSGTTVKSSIEFVDNGIEHDAKSIDFAFHAGAEWLMIDTKLSVISKIIERNIPCRVLINDEESVQNVIPHMRTANKAYVGLTQNIKQWKEFQKQYPDFIQVKVSHIPLLHAFYHIKSEENSAVRLAYYSYDNATMQKNFAHIFEHESTYYNLYVNEFEYLWEQASDIQDIQ